MFLGYMLNFKFAFGGRRYYSSSTFRAFYLLNNVFFVPSHKGRNRIK